MEASMETSIVQVQVLLFSFEAASVIQVGVG